jgi:hypothetical protein
LPEDFDEWTWVIFWSIVYGFMWLLTLVLSPLLLPVQAYRRWRGNG